MEVVFTNKFLKDIRKLKDKSVAKTLEETILAVKESSNVHEIKNLKKLRGFQNAFRIKMGDYRVGIFITNNTVEFACFLNRKDIYKFFP